MKKNILFTVLLGCVFFSIHAQTWDHVGSGVEHGVPDFIRGMYNDTASGKLYVGGNFRVAGGLNAFGIATWDGSAWDTVGLGMQRSSTPQNDTTGSPNYVMAIIRYKGEIYAGGAFPWAGTPNTTTGGLAKFDGAVWKGAGSPMSSSGSPGSRGAVLTFLILNDELYAAGAFDTIGGIPARSIARYNGTAWNPVIPQNTFGSFADIVAMAFYKGELYIAGNWSHSSNNIKYEDMLKWDGTQLLPLGNGFSSYNSFISSLALYKGELYVGGRFQKAWGDPGDNIVKWDGTSWSEVGNGLNDIVYGLKVFNGELYAGGYFTDAGGIAGADHIARWDGTSWKEVGGDYVTTRIGSMEGYKGKLYASGFQQINGQSCNNVARYTPDVINSVEEKREPNQELSVFPNPSTGVVSLQLNSGCKTAIVEAYTVWGEKTYSQAVNGLTGTVQLNFSSFPKGLYLIRVNAGDKVFTGRIVLN
jgi:trimeric autotransporter adhesin